MNPELSNAYEQLDQRMSTLFDRLSAYDDGLLQQQPAADKWSVIQVLDHLIHSERRSVLYCQKKLKAGDDIPESTIFNDLKMKLYDVVLSTKIKFKAPPVVSTPDNSRSLKATRAYCIETHQLLRGFLESYPEKYLSKGIFKHPVAGRITLLQMVRFFDVHVRHHLHQINRTLAEQS